MGVPGAGPCALETTENKNRQDTRTNRRFRKETEKTVPRTDSSAESSQSMAALCQSAHEVSSQIVQIVKAMQNYYASR